MPAPRKYPEELKERATRLALDARGDLAARRGAFSPAGDAGDGNRHRPITQVPHGHLTSRCSRTLTTHLT